MSQQLKTPAHTLLLPTAGCRRTVNCSFKLCHWRDLRRPHQVFECSPRSCGLKDTRCALPAGVAATSRPAGVAAGRVFPGWLRVLRCFPLRRRRRERRRKPLPPLDQGVATRVTSWSGCYPTPPPPLPPHPLTAEPKITCTVTAHTYLCKYVFVRRLHFLLDRSTKATNGRRALKKSAVASDVTEVYDKRNLFK